MADRQTILSQIPTEPGETWISCSDLQVGDVIPDAGEVTAVSEPDRDGEFAYRTTRGGRSTALRAGIISVKRGKRR